MRNIDKLENCLKSEGIRYDREILKDTGDPIISFRQTIESSSILVTFSFNPGDTWLEINCFGIAHFDNPLKRENLLELINDLNSTSRFACYYLTSRGDLQTYYTMAIGREGVFSPEAALGVTASIIDY